MADHDPWTPSLRIARRHDHERYLACLLAPSPQREELMILLAFNHEIAKTAEVVSEPLLGQIRLQWWRETLAQARAGRAPAHEVAGPLVELIARRGLDPGLFDRIIDAREFDLEGAPPADLAQLERYAEDSSAVLLHLMLQVLEADSEGAIRAARHLGIAWALTGLLRAVPFHVAHRRLYLPADHLAAVGLSPQDVLDGRSSEALSGVTMRLAQRAEEHLAASRACRSEVPSAALPVLLPAVLAERHLRVLARCGYDPFRPEIAAPLPAAALYLGWAKLRRRY